MSVACLVRVHEFMYISTHFRYDKSGYPEACPISNLDAALNWNPGQDDLCVPSISLSSCQHSHTDSSAPRMLICHDMMGGYKKDRFVQGHR